MENRKRNFQPPPGFPSESVVLPAKNPAFQDTNCRSQKQKEKPQVYSRRSRSMSPPLDHRSNILLANHQSVILVHKTAVRTQTFLKVQTSFHMKIILFSKIPNFLLILKPLSDLMYKKHFL